MESRPAARVQVVKLGVEFAQRFIHDRAYAAQGVLLRNKFFESFKTEPAFLHYVGSTHLFIPAICLPM